MIKTLSPVAYLGGHSAMASSLSRHKNSFAGPVQSEKSEETEFGESGGHGRDVFMFFMYHVISANHGLGLRYVLIYISTSSD